LSLYNEAAFACAEFCQEQAATAAPAR